MLRSLFEFKKKKGKKNLDHNFWLYAFGEFVLVRNDSLRQQITLVYAVRYPKVEKTQDILFTHIFDHLYPALRTNLQTLVPREVTVPLDLEQLRQNNGFLEDLNMTIFIYNLSIRTYRRALVSTEILIADIEKELS